MTSWTLVIIFWLGSNAGQTIVLQNLPTYQECVRVYGEVSKVHPYFPETTPHTKCIEVKK